MKTIAKSAKLQREEAAKTSSAPDLPVQKPTRDNIKIKPLKMFGELIAVLRFTLATDMLLPKDSGLEDRGIVIGVGRGVASPDGTYQGSQVKPGDVILFMPRSIITSIEPKTGVYMDKQVIVLNERQLILRLPPVKFDIIEDQVEEQVR